MNRFSRRTKWEIGGAVLALLLIMGSAGAASGTGAGFAPEPTPRVVQATPKIVTVQASPQIVIETKEVPVPTTPPECADALGYADTIIGLAGEGFSHTTDAISAISDGRWDAAQKAIDGLSGVNDRMSGVGSKYTNARDACLSK